MPQEPSITVVIPVRNASGQLRSCLRTLQDAEGRHDVIVVDDASTDDSRSVAAACGARVIRLAEQSGPATARNRGAAAAATPYVVFVDADVCVHPDTLERFRQQLDAEPSLDAIFGSYDTFPQARNFVSQYKNLTHHFVHQIANREATTFWAGCGAVRRDCFLRVGGFDEAFRRPCIEDIEFGTRLTRLGGHVRLEPSIQAVHLKRWTLWGLLKSDVVDRAIPWTRLILRDRHYSADLNLRASQRWSVAVTCFAALGFALQCVVEPWLLLVPASVILALFALDYMSQFKVAEGPAKLVAAGTAIIAALAPGLGGPIWLRLLVLSCQLVLLTLNLDQFRFFRRVRGTLFAIGIYPLIVLYFFYSGAAYLFAHLVRDPAPRSP